MGLKPTCIKINHSSNHFSTLCYSLHLKLLVILAFSRYIDFAMYLGIIYIYMHNKNYISRKTKMTNNLGWRVSRLSK